MSQKLLPINYLPSFTNSKKVEKWKPRLINVPIRMYKDLFGYQQTVSGIYTGFHLCFLGKLVAFYKKEYLATYHLLTALFKPIYSWSSVSHKRGRVKEAKMREERLPITIPYQQYLVTKELLTFNDPSMSIRQHLAWKIGMKNPLLLNENVALISNKIWTFSSFAKSKLDIWLWK